MSTMTRDPVTPLLQRASSLVNASPELKHAALMYEAILPVLDNADLHVSPLPLDLEQARMKMEQGSPLLQDADVELDAEELHQLMIRLARAIEAVSRGGRLRRLILPWIRTMGAAHGSAGSVRRALEQKQMHAGDLLQHIAADDKASVASAAGKLKLDPDLVWTLAQNAFKPALREWRRQMEPLVEANFWDRGYCFVCGAKATLAELQGNDQVKHLRCGSCGADWKVRRPVCVHCGNEDHRTLKFLYVDGQGDAMRVEACDACKRYLKVISAFTPASAELLPLEDLATLHLDYIAEEHGYTR